MTRALLLSACLLAFPREAEARPVRSAAKTALARILERCPTEARADFLGRLRFIGPRLADLEHGALSRCLPPGALDELARELSLVGQEAPEEASGDVAALFPLCKESARRAFFKSLVFREGRLTAMKDSRIRRCGEADVARFASLFGGLENE